MSTETRGRVLLVDDEPVLLELTSEALREAGFTVETAPNGDEAYRRIVASEPEVVVADVEMPGMDGYDLCRKVRASGRDSIPFLFCSGSVAPDARLKGLQAGADDFIHKPANPEELVLKLSRQVERVRQVRALARRATPVRAAELAAIEERLHQGVGPMPLGRFELHTIVGRGSMGTVFRAFDTKLERWVALKTVRASAAMAGFWDGDLVRGLVAEAAMVARFNHPHVVAVHDVQDAADAAYLVMEYVDGTSLQGLLKRQGRLEPARAVPLLGAVASALAAAHAIGLIHRDVKPANVLLGKDGAIKLGDFGISSFISSRLRRSVFGTPGFMPPEALRGGQVGPSGDLFALGAIAYRCLTGRPAFRGRSPTEIIQSTLNVRPPALREAGVEAPPELEALVADLLQIDPGKRASDAASLAAELRRLAASGGHAWTAPTLDESAAGEASGDLEGSPAQVVSTPEARTQPAD
jgi:serine/threonine-protein kinase